MKVLLALTTVALILVSGRASAEILEDGDRFMAEPPEETVYASEHHMAFSVRSAIISWFGGVPIVDESDLRASQRENWWGETVPLLPPEVLTPSER